MRNQIQIKNDSILLDARLSFYRYKAKEVQMNSLFPFFFFTLNQPEDKDIMKKPVLLLLFKKTIFILIYIILI